LGKIPSPKILIEAMGEVKPHLICIVPLILEKIYRKQIKPSLEKGVVKLAMRVPLLDTQVYASVCNRLTESFGGGVTQGIAGGGTPHKSRSSSTRSNSASRSVTASLNAHR